MRCNSSINRGKRVFLTRLSGGRRLFVTYQWGKPQPGTQLLIREWFGGSFRSLCGGLFFAEFLES